MRYLDPKNDLTFKKVFGQHPRLLRSFLNAILPLPEGSFIESLEYLPAELVPEIPLIKNSIVDVRCQDNRGRQFIVEMQMHWTIGFMQRVLFNASKAYVKQLDKSYQYNTLKPVYALSLVNEIFDSASEDYYHHYQIVNVADTNQQIEGLEFVFVELPKFKAKTISELKLSVLWLRFMTEIDESTTELPAELLVQQDIMEAIENLQESAFSKSELESYDKYWDSIRTEKTLQTGFYDKGRAEGKAEGKAEGRAEGEEIGIKKAKIEMVKNAKKLGLSPADIAKMTGLSNEEIEGL